MANIERGRTESAEETQHQTLDVVAETGAPAQFDLAESSAAPVEEANKFYNVCKGN